MERRQKSDSGNSDLGAEALPTADGQLRNAGEPMATGAVARLGHNEEWVELIRVGFEELRR